MRDTTAALIEASGWKNPELNFSLLDAQAAVPSVNGRISAAVEVLQADEKQDRYLHYCDWLRIRVVDRVSI